MTIPLLTTKLYIPSFRSEMVPRPRLIERLNVGLGKSGSFARKLTLVSAPAGFGKTTLLSEWIVNCGWPVAWISLDEGDNDLSRFLTYFVAALQTIEGNVGQGVLAVLQSPGPVNAAAVLTTLLNEIAEFPNNFILILDDYHVIESQPIDDALTFLLDHLPPQMHLVIASRTDPTLPLSRLRARRQLTELREADLRFTTDEAAAFLQQAVRLPISSDDVRTLEKRTEGWITGLQLAAVAMQGLGQREQITRFVHSFSGSHRYIIDYLIDEVLDQQTLKVQEFLLQTSILDRMTASLCNVVTSQENSQAILKRLETANLFLIPLDGERRWYRYHHLFADLLTHRLTQTLPDLVPALHQRASVWYEEKGFTDDAFRHAQASDDTRRAVEIVEECWQNIIHRGELTKLRSWLDSLGPEWTKKSAPLSMAYCWIHNLTGAIDAVPRYIQDTRKALKAEAATEDVQQPIKLAVMPSLIETMEAAVALHDKQAGKAKEHAKRAIALIPDDPNPATRWLLQGAAGFRLAQAHRELGEYDQACVVLLDVLEMLKASQNHIGAANTIWQIVTLYQQLGKTQQAITLCKDALGYIEAHHWEKMPPSGMVNLILADLQADSGNVTAARNNLEIGQKLVEPIKSQQILNLINRVEGKLDRKSHPQPLVEPLSQRELEVLQLIAQGLSNREISERLFLALATVKGHNRRIYGKLQVQRRTEAVARARELGLL